MWTDELEREMTTRRLRERLRWRQRREATIYALYLLIAIAGQLLKLLLRYP